MIPFGGFETETKHVFPLHPSSARAIQRNRKAECQRHVSTVSLGVNNMRAPFKADCTSVQLPEASEEITPDITL
jgi:hypothetical protein